MKSEVVLIVVAHADDETIAMGGTIARHIAQGDQVAVISMTDGVGARLDATQSGAHERNASAMEAAKLLGFRWFKRFDFQDNGLDTHPLLDIVQAIEEVKKTVQPTLVYCHSGADLNVDHRIVGQAVLTAFRPQPGEACRELRLFEVASATDYGNPAVTGTFSPNLYINVGPYWEVKEAALMAYRQEMREAPHSRSIEGIKALAKYRGHQVGLEKAEAFQVIRKIED